MRVGKDTVVEAEKVGIGSAAAETERARRASGVSAAARASARGSEPSDPEVPAIARRRSFTAEYKRGILEEADRCAPGEVGALLRREGLYSSHLTNWRKEREMALRSGLAPRKRGRKSQRNPLAGRVAELERDNARLRVALEKAEIIIDVQKKVARLLNDAGKDGTNE